MTEYNEFIATKKKKHLPAGFSVDSLDPVLYPFQSAITKWAIRMGRCAIFADCGLGKTLMQVEWAKKGTQAEIARAEELLIPIYYSLDELKEA